ncbi:MAG: S8 family serine peptidase, partial [Pseudomonadota bacterium]|nr:S8 family serine peptidase [Pseudomonadota bacterium]
MIEGFRIQLLRTVAVAGCIALAACGDGGGGVNNTPAPSTPAPTPTPTPTPTSTLTPVPGLYDTAEYRASVGPVSANALAAYDAGATGAGVKVGIVDSGIDLQSPEFDNRIDPASAYVAGTGTVDDEGGHGTAVAFTVAGRANDAGTHGMAFQATLVVARADTPGSCATKDSKGDPGCTFSETSIAKGIDLAVANGVRVINMSLGGSPTGSPVVSAINRATAAGVIVVIAAGNDGTDNPDP